MAVTDPSTRLAWVLGAAGLISCALGAWVMLALDSPRSFLPIYLVGALMAVLGSLVARREPGNGIGWLMCATGLVTGFVHIPAGSAYFALVTQHGAWPLGAQALWISAWSWVLLLAFVPLISVRFPDGRVPARWHFVDWLALAGTFLFALGIALNPARIEIEFIPLRQSLVDQMAASAGNPLALPHSVAALAQGLGLVLTVLAYVGSAASVLFRLRGSGGDVRLQLEWYAYAGALVAAAFVYAAVAYTVFGQALYLALTPLGFAALALPIAIVIAILEYRLYDIDLLINRTLVYASLTAILGAMYAAVVTFLNRLFISLSGQKSDAAYVVTAFAVAAAFGPVKDWLQRQVDHRIGRGAPDQLLDEFRADIDAVVTVLDVNRVARMLVDHSVVAFHANGAAIYLAARSDSEPVYSLGEVNGDPAVEVSLHHDGRPIGRLVMGARRGNVDYSERDRLALQRSANSVAEALALAQELGRVPVA